MSIYARDVSHLTTLDPYRLQELYRMHPCAEHVVKKLLVAGEREGAKDLDHDISDCIRTLTRWQAMRAEDAAYAAKPQRPSWATHTLIGFDGERQFVRSDGKGNFLAYTQESAVASHIYTPNNFDMSTLVSLGCPAVVVSPGIDAACEAGTEFVSRYDWSVAPLWARYAATDASGFAYWYADRPTQTQRQWEPKTSTGSAIQHVKIGRADGRENWIFTIEARPA